MADDENPQSTDSPTPPSGFLIFFVVTLIVTGLKIFMPGSAQYFDSAYILVIIISQYLVNLNLTKELCYELDYKTAFMTTLFPWVIIFGVMNLMLTIFPGWLVPFSNTFGYFIATLAGSKDLVRKIFKDPKTETAGDLARPLSYIYNDQSLLVNEVSIENFDTFWNKSGTLKTGDAEQYKDDFKKLIVMKDTISKCIWQLLAGGLITSISYNYILNGNCMPTAAQAQESSDKFKANLSAEEERKNNQPEYSKNPFM